MYCKNCGKEINKDAKFCKYCGKESEKDANSKKNILKNKYLIILIIILLFAFFIRLYYFNVNQAIWWDEADYLLEAKRLAFGIEEAPLYGAHRAPFLPFLWSWGYKIGLGEKSILFTQIIFSLLTVFLTYLIGKDLYNKKVGLLATFLMAIFWQNLFFTIRFLTEIPSLFFWMLSICLFIKGLKNHNYFYFLFPSIVLAILTRFPTGVVLFVILVQLIMIKNIKLVFNKKVLVSIILGALIIIPYFIYAFINYNDAFAFLTQAEAHTKKYGEGIFTVFMQHIQFFPEYLGNALLIILVISFIFILFRLIFYGNLLLKYKDRFASDFFLVIWILIPLLIQVFVFYFRPRYLIFISPAILILISFGIFRAYDFLKKYDKSVSRFIAIPLILLILILGSYNQIVHADSIIEIKADSYLQVKEAALWIKENSNKEDIIFTKSVPQNIYYSERKTYTYPENELDFNRNVTNLKPKYMVVSGFENHEKWIYEYPVKNNLTAVNAYFLDKNQPILVIYELSQTPQNN